MEASTPEMSCLVRVSDCGEVSCALAQPAEARIYACLGNLVSSFDSVSSLYLDGVPCPRFCSSVQDAASTSYCFHLARRRTSSDQADVSSLVEFVPVSDDSTISSEFFTPLCHYDSQTSPSARIGCNLSLYVGAFSFCNGKRGVPSSDRLCQNEELVAIPRRTIDNHQNPSPGHLPITAFISETAHSLMFDSSRGTTKDAFITTVDPDEASRLAMCKVVTVDSGSNTQNVKWELCEVLDFDAPSATFRVRLPRMRTSSGALVEKTVTRSSIALGQELRDTKEHDQLLEVAKFLRADFERQFRTDLLLDMWESDESTSQAMSDDVVRRVLRLVSLNVTKTSLPILDSQLKEMRSMCGRSLNLAKLAYLCLHPHFRRLLAPLSISIPTVQTRSLASATSSSSCCDAMQVIAPQTTKQMKRKLEASLRWEVTTKCCVDNIVKLWRSKYDGIVLLDTRYRKGECVALPSFLRHARSSLEVGVALIRVSLLSDVDVSMMTDLEGSRVKYTYVNAAAYYASELCQVFRFAQVFLSSQLKTLALRAARDLRRLFHVSSCCDPAEFGVNSDTYYLVNGVKPPQQAQLVIELKYIDGGTVKALPELQRVEGELLELVDDLVKELNSFTKPDVYVMASLNLPQSTMDVVSANEGPIVEAKGSVTSAVALAAPIVEKLIDAYGQHALLVEKFVVEDDDYFGQAESNGSLIERIEGEVSALRKILDQVTWTSPELVSCGVLCVDCSHVKRTLLKLWERRIQDLLEMVERNIYESSVQAVRVCKKMRQRLTTRPTCVEELDELLTYSEDAKRAIALIRDNDVVNVISWVSLLERLHFTIAEDAFGHAYQLVHWPAVIDEVMNASEALFVTERAAMAEELETYKMLIRSMIKELDDGVVALLGNTEQDKSDVAVTLARSLRVLTESIEERITVATRRETMLGMEIADFSEFFPVKSTFEALEQFWVTLSDSSEHLQRFYDTPIAEANADRMIESVERWRRLLRAATRSLRGYPALFALGRKQEQFIMQFELATPVIEMLTQPGVRQIHWKEISKRLGVVPGRELLPSDPQVTVYRILSEGALNHMEEISSIVAQAATDFAAETRLEKMKSDTRKQLLIFETFEMPVGQVNALSNASEISALLDGFVMQSQHLHSRYNLQTGLAQAAAEWETMLLNMQDTMNLWTALQTDWLQLRPTVLVPAESTSVVSGDMVQRFRQVDDLFRQILDEIDRPNQNLFVVMTIETLPNRLAHVASQLKTVREGILLLMDAKRAAFPRFYFLNDKEMLTCLSALNIRAVTGLLQRMYPRLCGLDLAKGDVSGFVTSDGVRMRCDPSYPVTSEPIETWMHGLESCLVKALRSSIEFALSDSIKTQARSWLLRYSGQLIDVVLRIRYATDIDEVLSAVGTRGLTSYLKKSLRMLEEYFQVSAADLNSSEHRTVSNSISFMLYCREEVQAMIDEGVQTAEQLESFPIMRTVIQDSTIRVRLFHLAVPYGNEFLGNYTAPIMTPVMFRSIRTLFMSYVATAKTILAGSGGVGKKQTISDFATFIGAFLWSVQCHDHMTVTTLAPLLRALVGVGGWLCLDDVNLLRPEVQTEVVRVIRAIDMVQKSKGSVCSAPLGKTTGEMVSLHVGRTFNLVATSSVDYEQLPLTLGSAFRPIFLQPVDFTVVAKTYLCSLGFENEFVSLGDAVGSIFQQFHDVLPGIFSVRSLILTIRTARTLAAPSLSAKLCIALRESLGPALKCYNPEMERLFESRVSAISTDYDALTLSFAPGHDESVASHALVAFEKLMQVHSNVIVYGPHYSGKTRMISSWGNQRNTIIVAPQNVSSAMYYGEKGSGSGLLASLFRECSSTGEHLLWFEDVNLRADDTSAWIQCASSQRKVHVDDTTCVVMGAETCVVATCTTLKDASPSIVSRFGLFSSGDANPWQEQLRVCGTMLSSDSDIPQVPLAMHLMEALIPPLLESVCTPISLHDAVTLASTFFQRWYHHVLMTSNHSMRLATDKLIALMVQCCVFSIAWSIGLRLDQQDRPPFEDAFQQAHEAVASIVCQHDSTIEVYPPGNILSFVATSNGWKLLMVEENTDTWCHMSPQESRVQRGWTLFAYPAHSKVHHSIELLLHSGQHVFVTGAEQSGKSHMIRRCTKIPSWTTVVVTGNKDSSVALFQETLTPRLVKRQSKVYGPSVGKQLMICVDDLHLGAAPDPYETEVNVSNLSHVISFVGRRRRLCTEALGVIGLRETTILATGLPTNWNSYFTRSCVEVRLPPIRGTDVIRYVWTLMERCTTHRNLAEIGRDAATFLIVAHDAFIRSPISNHSSDTTVATKDQRSYVFIETLRRESIADEQRVETVSNEEVEDDAKCNDDDEDDWMERNSNPGADEEGDAFWGPASPLHNPWVRLAEPNATKDVHRIFAAFDAVRRLMVGSMPDSQLIRGVAAEVNRVYSCDVETDRKADVAELLLEVARRTIASTDKSLVEAHDISTTVLVTTETNALEQLPPDACKKRVLNWVGCFNKAPAVELAELTAPFTNVSQVSLTNSHGGLSAFRNKVLMSYKLNLMAAGTGLGAPNKPTPTQQQLQQQQLQAMDSNVVIAPTTTTMVTKWLETHIPPLLALMQPVESHVALFGTQVFGVTRLVRLATAISNVPLVMCQCERPSYDLKAWRGDLQTLIRYAAKKGVRVALFVPSAALSIPGVLADIDLVVRTGSCAPFFSAEEFNLLLDTAKKAGGERADPSLELEQRIRQQTMIVTHFTSVKALHNAKLSFPAFASHMQTMHAGDRKDWSNGAYADLVSSALMSSYGLHVPYPGSEDALGQSSTAPSTDPTLDELLQRHTLDLISDCEATAALLCEVFTALASEDDGIVEEQVIEFAQLVGYLQKKRIPDVEIKYQQTTTFHDIKAKIQSCTTADSRTKKELSPEFEQLNDAITKLERSVTAQTATVEGHRKAFEALESSTMQMVTMIDGRKQQMTQLNESMESSLDEARAAITSIEQKHVKALGAMMVPPARARVLMEAVYLVFGEEVPKAAATQQELWNAGRKLLCDPSFVPKMLSVGPHSTWMPSFEQLKPFLDAFDVARFGSFSPYAQVVANLITAIVAAVAIKEKCTDLEVQITDSRIEMLSLVDDLERSRDTLFVSSKKLDEDRVRLSVFRNRRTFVFESLQKCEQRLMRLHRLATNVDTFEMFMRKSETDADVTEQHNTILGDIVLVASRLTVFGAQSAKEFSVSTAAVCNVLRQHNIPFTQGCENNILATLQQEPMMLAHQMVGIRLPQSQVQLLGALTKRTFFRWPVFAASNALFEECVMQQLRDSCVDCVVVNASAPNLPSVVLEAVRNGYGLLVRHFNGSDVVRRLRSVLSLLPSMIRHGDHMQSSGTSESEPLVIQAFGKSATVHPKFYMVFTVRETRGELALESLRAAQQWLVVNRLTEPITSDSIVHNIIVNHKASSCIASMNEFRTRVKEQRAQQSEFYRGKFAAAKLITERQESIADDEATIAELGMEVARMERTSIQLERQRQMAEHVLQDVRKRWDKAIVSIASMLDAVQRIEGMLGRDPLSQPFVTDMVEGAYSVSAFMEDRFHVDRIANLPDHEQPMMVVLCCVERVLHTMRTGWPQELRHIFTVVVLSVVRNSVLFTAPVRTHDETGEELLAAPSGQASLVSSVSESTHHSGYNLSLEDALDLLQLLTVYTPTDMVRSSAFTAVEWRGKLIPALIQKRLDGPFHQATTNVSPTATTPQPNTDLVGPTSDIATLVEGVLSNQLVQSNAAAASIVARLGVAVFGELIDKRGNTVTSQCCASEHRPNQYTALFQFCGLTGTPLYVEADDLVYRAEEMVNLAESYRYSLSVVHCNSNAFDVDEVLVALAHQLRQRAKGERRGHCCLIVLEACHAGSDVEVRAAMLQHICNMLPLLRDVHYTSLCGGRANEDAELLTMFLVDKKRVALDLEVVARTRSLHFCDEIQTPKAHLEAILEQNCVFVKTDWWTVQSHPFHYKLNCLLKGVLLFHAHQSHRQRTNRCRAREYRTEPSVFISDGDLETILSLIRAHDGSHDVLTTLDPFATVRLMSILLYASRSRVGSEEERLIKVASKFVHSASITGGFRFMDVYESDPDLDLNALHAEITNSPSNLCEISGDVLAADHLVRAQQQRASVLLSGVAVVNNSSRSNSGTIRRRSSVAFSRLDDDDGEDASPLGDESNSGPLSKPRSAMITSVQRTRRSFFVPDAPAYRRSFARVAERRRSSNKRRSIVFGTGAESSQDTPEEGTAAGLRRESTAGTIESNGGSFCFFQQDAGEGRRPHEGDVACWTLEMTAIQQAIAASKRPPGALEERMLATLQHVVRSPPTQVRSIWLPALQYPTLFLSTYMHARLLQVVQDEGLGVYASFALVCLASPNRVRPDDLVLVDASLPEKRLRNQTDATMKRRTSSEFSYLTPEDRQPWVIEEAEPTIVLRACPRGNIPSTVIPMLRSENLVNRDGDDNNDTIEMDETTTVTADVRTKRLKSGYFSKAGREAAATTTPLLVEAERLDAGKVEESQDFLDDDFIGGKNYTVFLSRVEIPLLCFSIVPQSGKRRWRTLVSLPFLVERQSATIVRMETRRQSAILQHLGSMRAAGATPLSIVGGGSTAGSASFHAKAPVMIPVAPTMPRVASSGAVRPQRTRRTTIAADAHGERPMSSNGPEDVNGEFPVLQAKQSGYFQEERSGVMMPTTEEPQVSRFYWLPMCLEYTLNAE